MTEKNYLEAFEKCPGSVYFPLLEMIALLGDILCTSSRSLLTLVAISNGHIRNPRIGSHGKT